MVEKKKGKGLKILLLILLLIVLTGTSYIFYLKGAFNWLLDSLEMTNNLTVQNLDIDEDEIDEQQYKVVESEINDNCKRKYLVNQEGTVEVANIECEISSESIKKEYLKIAKTAATFIKGVDFDYEVEDDETIDLEIKVAPADIDQDIFDRLKEMFSVDDNSIDELKKCLDNPTVEILDEAIKKVIS